jgi:glycine/D-amino acid oxidase-like deaminating enzyme/nitrite reductase/ring-hydroxylating ferredoxin subunit
METHQAIWSSIKDAKTFPPLSGDIHADVVIVGAGITGLSTAYLLAKAGKNVVVLEQHQVGKGTTGSSTGNLYAPIDERLFSIGSKHNEATMRMVAKSRTAAIAFIEQRVQEYAMDCDFQRVPWHLFTTKDTNSQNSQVEQEKQAALQAGLKVSEHVPVNFPFQVEELLTLDEQAQFNPLKYVQQLAASIAEGNCRIFENTQVTDVKEGVPCAVHTAKGTVRAEKVVMATHSPKGIYGVHTAMETYREYALAVRLKGELPKPGVYWHVQSGPQFSIRPYSNEKGNFLLVLGEPYKVGNKSNNEENVKNVEVYLRTHFDIEAIETVWAAQNYKPADNLPYIGTSPLETHTYLATGFAADGLTYGTLAGMIICDAILKKDNPWAEIYKPTRFTPAASASRFIKENITVAKNLVKDYLFYGEAEELKEIEPGEGKTIKLNDERVAAYRDDQGKIRILSAICPHMGCIVHWNNVEKSWDCPCHGSRFSVEGEVLEGPAFTGLAKPGGDMTSKK